MSCKLSYLAIIEVVGYKVHQYIPTEQFRFEEWSKEPPWTTEEVW